MTIIQLSKQPPMEITPEMRKQIAELGKRPVTPEEAEMFRIMAEENEANFRRGMLPEVLADYLRCREERRREGGGENRGSGVE